MRITLIILAALIILPAGIYAEFVYPEKAIRAELAESGITNVNLHWKMFSGTIFTRCNDKNATVRSYTGLKDGRHVEGVACYTTFWGAAHWDG